LWQFSPDGKYVLASTSNNGYVVLDAATGHLVATLDAPPGLLLRQVTWDGDTVLAVVSDASPSVEHEAIVRFGLDGGRPSLAAPIILVKVGSTGYTFGPPS
jgi:hypothetical protein